MLGGPPAVGNQGGSMLCACLRLLSTQAICKAKLPVNPCRLPVTGPASKALKFNPNLPKPRNLGP